MVELVVIACLIAQPSKCEAFDLPFQQPMAMRQCMFEGQLRIVEWARTRPGWRVRRWRCEVPSA